MYYLTDRVNALFEMIDEFLRSPDVPVAFDTETTGLNFLDHRLITLQFKQFGHDPVIFDVRRWPQRDLRRAGDALQQLFDVVQIVGMNLTFDYKFVLKHMGAKIRANHDVMIGDQVIYGLGKTGGNNAGIHFDLRSISGRYDLEVSKEVRSIFPDMDKSPLWHQPFDSHILEYMAQDVDVLQPIYERQKEAIEQNKLTLCMEIESRCLPSVAQIEYNGIHIHKQGWELFIESKRLEAEKYYAQAVEMIGEAVAAHRAQEFQMLSQAYQEWEQARDAKIAELKIEWESPETQALFTGWGVFKAGQMSLWRAANPNPGKPKMEDHTALAAWYDEETKFKQRLKEQYKAIDDRGMAYEEYEQGMMQGWYERNPKPDGNSDIPSLHEARQLCYKPINLSSPKMMLEAFHILGIPATSTSKDALDALPEGEWPVVDVLKAYRKANMFPVKFGAGLLQNIHQATDRIHPSYIQIGADTGRMSCTNPPWQQVPAKGDGAKLRALVVPQDGNVMLTADFSNIELRILADLSGDRNMLKFFAEGLDLHAETARMMFKLPANLTAEEIKNLKAAAGYKYRDAAKTINFGLVYGMSANKLARTLKIPKEEAKDLMDRYFALYPGVVRWLQRQRLLGVSRLQSRTASGRVRYYHLPAPNTQEYNQQKAAVERKSMNTPIQGLSADITKVAMALFHEQAPDFAWLVAVVHDELVVECPREHAEEVAKLLGNVMDRACKVFLKKVVIPPTIVNIGEAWEKI